jgi:hypothetical protein
MNTGHRFQKSCFSKLDIFGIGYSFLINGQDKLRTITGATFTLIYCVIILSLFFGFGVDLYLRKNPKVSFNTEISNYKMYNLSNKNFTYAYRVEDENGEIFLDDTVVYPVVYYGHYEIKNGSWVLRELKELPRKRCLSLDTSTEKEAYYNISLKNWFCVDFDNMSLGGNWDGNFVTFLQINIYQCNNSTRNNTCKTEEQIIHTLKHPRSSGNLFFSDLSLNLVPFMNNYENPFKTNLVNNYYLLSLELAKRKIFTLKNTYINNDVGWFFEDVKRNSVITTDTVFPDMTLKDKWDQNLLYSSYLYLGNKIDTYYRSYTKIQEVIASVGGFAKFFYTCIFLLYTSLNSFFKNWELIQIFPFNEDEYMHQRGGVAIKPNLENSLQELKRENSKLSESKETKRNTYYKFWSLFCYRYCNSKNTKNYHLEKFRLYRNYFEKYLNITSYYKLNNNFKTLLKITLSKPQIRIIKLVKPKLKEKKENFENQDISLNLIRDYFTTTNNISNINNSLQDHNFISLLDHNTKSLLKLIK